MAGHSKWKNIQNRKGAQDSKRGKAFTKVIKEISVAVKTGGGGDPSANPRLRAAIQAAKAINMPRDNVERAIKKALGGEGGEILEVSYEGYGPGGVAVYVECATDNITRTVGNVRSYFTKHGGNLGKEGCLQFVFNRKAVFSLAVPDKFDEDEFTLEIIDSGAEDVEIENGLITITAEMEYFGEIQKALENKGMTPDESGLRRIPVDMKSVDVKTYESIQKLIEKLEDDDDVQNVYHNIEYSEEFENL